MKIEIYDKISTKVRKTLSRDLDRKKMRRVLDINIRLKHSIIQLFDYISIVFELS